MREQIVRQAIDLGMTPLQVWSDTIADFMRQARRRGLSTEKRLEYKARAATIAAMMAPYLHPKLQSVEVRTTQPIQHEHVHRRGEDLTDQEAVEEWRRVTAQRPPGSLN